MDEQIKQIAERLRGLRDAMELTTEELANECGIDPKEYEQAESGEYDISVSMMQQIARRYGIALDALMFGEEPKMNTYFLTRAGKGVSRSRATVAASQGRSRRAERLAGKATVRWRRLRSSSTFISRCTVLTEVVSGNSRSR